MNRTPRFFDGPYGTYVQTLLAIRFSELRKKVSQHDVGASAIELAIITAVIGMVALLLAYVIRDVVNTKKGIIQGL